VKQDQLFRFEDLQVWQRAADLSVTLGGIADDLEERRRFRFVEQLRSAALSISNSIAEGSGSESKNEFRQFLNFARRSAFECASMLLAFRRQNLLPETGIRELIVELDEVCRMITSLSRTLRYTVLRPPLGSPLFALCYITAK
jgi:four helix bundle protein